MGNPTHPVVNEVRDQWHKFCAMIMFKQGLTRIEITVDDIRRFDKSVAKNILVHAHESSFELLLLNAADAERHVREREN